MNGKLNVSMNLKPLEALAKKSPAAFKKGMKKGALQFLTWANTGTGKSSKKPPIRFGVLRGSSSAFVGGELVDTYKIIIKPGAKESPSPATSHSAPMTTITWVWNTSYAAKMHEWNGPWGPFTIQDGNAGAKWVEDHLKADRDALIEMIGSEVKSELGL